jgi:DNA repair exonuclease SbcCD ATPase subunit
VLSKQLSQSRQQGRRGRTSESGSVAESEDGGLPRSESDVNNSFTTNPSHPSQVSASSMKSFLSSALSSTANALELDQMKKAQEEQIARIKDLEQALEQEIDQNKQLEKTMEDMSDELNSANERLGEMESSWDEERDRVNKLILTHEEIRKENETSMRKLQGELRETYEQVGSFGSEVISSFTSAPSSSPPTPFSLLKLTGQQTKSAQDQEQWESERAILVSKRLESEAHASVMRERMLTLKLELRSLKDSLQAITEQVENENKQIASTLKMLQNAVQKGAIRHQEEIMDLTSSYKKELSERRKYFNMVQDLKGVRSLFPFPFPSPFVLSCPVLSCPVSSYVVNSLVSSKESSSLLPNTRGGVRAGSHPFVCHERWQRANKGGGAA